MNKRELVERLVMETGYTQKDCNKFVDAFCDTVTNQLAKGEEIKIVGFGTFKAVERKARNGRNPHDPKKVIKIPATVSPRFKPGTALKDAVKKQ